MSCCNEFIHDKICRDLSDIHDMACIQFFGYIEKAIGTFSYAQLSRDDEVSARADAELIKHRLRRTAEDVIEIGLALIRQKGRLPHGAFIPWIESEFGMSERSARRIMSVADRFAGKTASLADLKPEALYELAAPSTPPEVRADVEALLVDGARNTNLTAKIPTPPVSIDLGGIA